MRSKQQPRPSYRWLDKDENVGSDNVTNETTTSDNKNDQNEQKLTENSNQSGEFSSSSSLLSNHLQKTSTNPQSSDPDQTTITTTTATTTLKSSSQNNEPQNNVFDGQETIKILSSSSAPSESSLLLAQSKSDIDVKKNESPSASPPLPPRHIINLPTTSNTITKSISPTSSSPNNKISSSTNKITTTTNTTTTTPAPTKQQNSIKLEENVRHQEHHKITLNRNQQQQQQQQQRNVQNETEVLPPPATLLRPSRNQRSTRSNTQRMMNMLDHSSVTHATQASSSTAAAVSSSASSYSVSGTTTLTTPTAAAAAASTPTTTTTKTTTQNNLIDSYDDASCSTSASHQHHHPSAERELASPRCQSRESSGSGGRCQSDDSNCSGNGSTTAPTQISPVGITLPATLQPSAAAALLPPQSAAMAAYLNAAAAAAQQNRLLLSNPLAASLVHQATGQSAPNLPLQSPIHHDDSSILDFSTKRSRRDSDTDSKSDSDAVNLSKSGDNNNGSSDNSPLDLSVGGRKRSSEHDPQQQMLRKIPRHQEYKPVPSPWVTPMTPYLAAVAAASLSPKNHLPVDWNGKTKMATNDATKALEKMSEMTRLGGNTDTDVPLRPSNNHSNNSSSGNTGSGGTGRHSAWQSHWLNKGADAAKDVFKCVWCKLSFPTLATLTTHMKETQHCGVNVPPSNNLPSQQQNNQQSHHHHHHHQSPSSTSSNTSSNKSDLNLLIKETMPLPRKLVRGQDVWLGKGAEQTRQILKCMWCGQSFRSLAEMTSHMQQTQHYTNIISQEQIISWKSSEDGKGGTGGTGGTNTGVSGNNSGSGANTNSNTNSTVSAVLTCKVCDQAFSSLKDLSNHMVKNAHYKEHIMRSITESGGRRRQTREKRKKSLPVRKLLELERAQHDFKNGDVKSMRSNIGGHGDLGSATRITCEKCGDKIETALFVEHIRQCVGGAIIQNSPRNSIMKTPLSVANSIIPPDSMSPLTPNSRDDRKSIGDESPSPASNRHISPHTNDLISPISSKDGGASGGGGGGGVGEKSSPSVLNAIEQLIEKSFDTRSRHSNSGFAANSHANAPLGSSILKRLGIDESVDYTKPLIDPQTMNLLRSYQHSQYSKRERSGSESSSVSDRGSSRLESLTPERKPDMLNHLISPRQTPDKLSNYSHQSEHEDDKDSVKVKREPIDEDNSGNESDIGEKIAHHKIKKEINTDDLKENEAGGELDLSSKRKANTPSSSAPSPHPFSLAAAISTPTASPAGSDRSTTPRSSNNSIGSAEKKMASGSLNALSSMFNNLTGSVNSLSNTNSDLDNAGHSSSGNQGKKGSFHPLAALQKLCDKTENNPQQRSGSTGALAANCQPNTNTTSGNILAFSWACNDAVMTSDSIIKCAFCDTPFCSKGAYRHHLSKVHFVKDESIDPSGSSMKSPSDRAPSAEGNRNSSSSSSSSGSQQHQHQHQHQQQQQQHQHQQQLHHQNKQQQQQHHHHRPHSRSQSPARASISSSNNGTSTSSQYPTGSSAAAAKSPSPSQPLSTGANPAQPTTAAQSPFDESPHSKFLKYTELAKQLSSKYV